MAKFFHWLENSAQARQMIREWGFSNTTLEQVPYSCTALYCTAPHRTALYCTVLHRSIYFTIHFILIIQTRMQTQTTHRTILALCDQPRVIGPKPEKRHFNT